jgi:hypothetical protein
MLAQLNPAEIIRGHLRTLDARPGMAGEHISPRACALFFSIGLPFAAAQALIVLDDKWLTGEAVGVIVSSASLIAGLLLNLLVLVYTLVATHEAHLTDARELFRTTAKHVFYNISFTVLVCLVLVVVCLMALANSVAVRTAGNLLTFYVGPLVAVSLLMVLRKCHALISFFFDSGQAP